MLNIPLATCASCGELRSNLARVESGPKMITSSCDLHQIGRDMRILSCKSARHSVSKCAVGEKGFPSKPRVASEGGFLEGADETEASRAAELRAGVLNLGLAWGLVALCCTHHAGHMLHGTGLHEVIAQNSAILQQVTDPATDLVVLYGFCAVILRMSPAPSDVLHEARPACSWYKIYDVTDRCAAMMDVKNQEQPMAARLS